MKIKNFDSFNESKNLKSFVYKGVDLKPLIIKTNRAKHQTEKLFDILDGDYNKLVDLEQKIKNCFITYCPFSKEECDKILKMSNKIDDYNFKELKN